jgi:hypothetical protein
MVAYRMVARGNRRSKKFNGGRGLSSGATDVTVQLARVENPKLQVSTVSANVGYYLLQQLVSEDHGSRLTQDGGMKFPITLKPAGGHRHVGDDLRRAACRAPRTGQRNVRQLGLGFRFRWLRGNVDKDLAMLVAAALPANIEHLRYG